VRYFAGLYVVITIFYRIAQYIAICATKPYNVESQVLNIADDQALFAINPLLKNPIFEVRQLTIEQIAEIEAMLDE
jgi:hypothetical protein